MPRRTHLPERPDVSELVEKTQRQLLQKQKALILLQDSDMSLSALKLIDLYLAKIEGYLPKDLTPEAIAARMAKERTVTIRSGELESTLGVDKINKQALRARLRQLYAPIDLHPDNEEIIEDFQLFKPTKGIKENGYWTITLECTDEALKYVFIPEGIHYLRYRLLNVVNLTSRYAYFLYMYLEDERHSHTDWIITIDELKKILGCSDQPYYQEFKNFNRKILAASQKELEEKTDCKFTYKVSRRNKKAYAISFHLQPKKEIKYKPKKMDQISFDDVLEEGETIAVSSFLTDAEYRDVSLMRLKVDNGLIKELKDTTIATCYKLLYEEYGVAPELYGFEGDPLEINAYHLDMILSKVRSEIDNKSDIGEKINNLDAYVIQATKNYIKENH